MVKSTYEMFQTKNLLFKIFLDQSFLYKNIFIEFRVLKDRDDNSNELYLTRDQHVKIKRF